MRDRGSFATYAVIAITVAVLGMWSWQRNEVYQSAVSLWEDNGLKSPNKARVFVNLAFSYKREGMDLQGIAALTKAIQIKPDLAMYFKALEFAYTEGGSLITEKDVW